MESERSIVWITEGREIENYIAGDILQAALEKIHSRIYLAPQKTGKYDHAFYFWRKRSGGEAGRETCKSGDKVGAAHIVCQQEAELNVLDLRERVSELVSMIAKANGLR